MGAPPKYPSKIHNYVRAEGFVYSAPATDIVATLDRISDSQPSFLVRFERC